MEFSHKKYACKVFFYSPDRLTDYLNESVVYTEFEDIITLTTTTTVNESVGTFSITIANNNLKYFEGDNIEDILKAYGNMEGKITSEDVETPRNSNLFPTKDKFTGFAYETIKDSGKLYRLYSEITPKNIYTDNTGNDTAVNRMPIRSKRWYFKPQEGDTDEVVFVTVEKVGDSYIYYREGEDVTAFVSFHTNSELFDKLGGKTDKTNPKIQPMDYVFIYMSDSVNEQNKPVYYRIFTGLVNKVSANRSGGRDILSIDGEDITKLMRLSIYATNPAQFRSAEVDTGGEVHFIYSSNLINKTAPQIIREMVEGVPKASVLAQDAKTNCFPPAHITNGPPEMIIDAISEDMFKSINFQENFTKIGILKAQDPKSAQLLDVAYYTPYRQEISNNVPEVITEYMDRLQVCREITKLYGFEFFADPEGYIYFREPDLDNYSVLTDPDKTYVLDSKSLRSYSISDDDSGIVTLIRVTGTLDLFGSDPFVLGTYSSYADRGLISRFGIRPFDVTSPLVGNESQCKMHAKSLMRKINADLTGGQVTIDLRPKIRPGNPVYLPDMNRMFYCSSVTHSYAAGTACTTSLGLQYGRAPWDTLSGMINAYATEKVMPYGKPVGKSGKISNSTDDNKKDASVTDNTGIATEVSYQFKEAGKRYNDNIQWVVFHCIKSPEMSTWSTNMQLQAFAQAGDIQRNKVNPLWYDFIVTKEGEVLTTKTWTNQTNGSFVKFSLNALNSQIQHGNVATSIFAPPYGFSIGAVPVNTTNTVHVLLADVLTYKNAKLRAGVSDLIQKITQAVDAGYCKFFRNSEGSLSDRNTIWTRFIPHSDIESDKSICRMQGQSGASGCAHNVNKTELQSIALTATGRV